ncbi:MAG: hypothetical protein V7694_09890 [Rhodococcus sp. (in: high G+C Gram-positive bacteria)]
MARAVADRMEPGSRIVFLTSHQAHFRGNRPIPTVAEFAAAVVDAAVGPIEKSGRTVYVGGADYLDGFVSG